MKIIVISTNIHKIEEIAYIFSDLNLSVSSYPNPPFTIEDGHTFSENALKKLQPIPPQKNTIFLSDDSGLEVEALNGAPGIYSARYAGMNATDIQNTQKLLKVLSSETNRRANFSSAIALKFPNNFTQCVEGKVFGTITHAVSGSHGFGYDPVFIPDGFTTTFADIPLHIKNKISHRYKALILAKDIIAQFIV